MKLKFVASVSASLLFVALLLTFLPVRGEEIVYQNVVRFHVLAASDSAEDQALKLRVRDATLTFVAPLLEECATFEEARDLLAGETERIRAVAAGTIAANGYDYSVTAELTRERYPTRIYEEIALPAGVYTSLKISIGDGEGQNWWCVLFPSICRSFSVVPSRSAEEEYLAVGFTPEQYRAITRNSSPEYRVRFKILELFSSLFR